jgi:predicted amidophosphoribosyltransferase
MTLEICQNCEKTFEAGKYARLCPKCRRELLSRLAKERNLSQIGNAARWGNCAGTKKKGGTE